MLSAWQHPGRWQPHQHQQIERAHQDPSWLLGSASGRHAALLAQSAVLSPGSTWPPRNCGTCKVKSLLQATFLALVQPGFKPVTPLNPKMGRFLVPDHDSQLRRFHTNPKPGKLSTLTANTQKGDVQTDHSLGRSSEGEPFLPATAGHPR